MSKVKEACPNCYGGGLDIGGADAALSRIEAACHSDRDLMKLPALQGFILQESRSARAALATQDRGEEQDGSLDDS